MDIRDQFMVHRRIAGNVRTHDLNLFRASVPYSEVGNIDAGQDDLADIVINGDGGVSVFSNLESHLTSSATVYTLAS